MGWPVLKLNSMGYSIFGLRVSEIIDIFKVGGNSSCTRER